jgi:RimJ/RimL family protein N-acetyltransferase
MAAFPELIETERLVLRRPRRSDCGAWLGIWGDPAVWSALRPGLTPDPRHALERFEHHCDHWRQHGFGLWLVEDSATRTIAGWAGPAHPTFVPELGDEVEIGWTLRRPFWGRGLAGEAAATAVDAAFAHLELERVIALVAADNRPSLRVAQRLGMRHDRDTTHPATGQILGVLALSRDAGGARSAARGVARGH